jgi:hypothetical protein
LGASKTRNTKGANITWSTQIRCNKSLNYPCNPSLPSTYDWLDELETKPKFNKLNDCELNVDLEKEVAFSRFISNVKLNCTFDNGKEPQKKVCI